MMKKMKPMATISSIIMYIRQMMPKMSHQRCGAASRQVFTEEYKRMFEVRNHAIASRESIVEHLRDASRQRE